MEMVFVKTLTNFWVYNSSEFLDHLKTVKYLSKTSTAVVSYWLKKCNVS